MAVFLCDQEIPKFELAATRRKRWTRGELEFLEQQGLFEAGTYELVEGELYSKMGKKRMHAYTVLVVRQWLEDCFGRAFVEQETPVSVAPQEEETSEPEPDILVLRHPSGEYRERHPRAIDLALLVEVSDTTFAFDMRVKAGLYARAGVEEYWVVDVNARKLIVLRKPQAGSYASVVEYSEGESVAPQAKPDREFPVSAAFA